MGGIFKTLSIGGAGEFTSYAVQLMSVADLIGDSDSMWGGLLADIGEYFVEKIEKNYETAGAEVGGFQILNEQYADEVKGGDTTPNLTLEGDYKDSWSWDPYESDGIIIHSSLENTKHLWHEFGTGDRGRNNPLPMRPVLNLLEADLAWIDEHFAQTFDTAIFRRL